MIVILFLNHAGNGGRGDECFVDENSPQHLRIGFDVLVGERPHSANDNFANRERREYFSLDARPEAAGEGAVYI